jgi:hypothetical protein
MAQEQGMVTSAEQEGGFWEEVATFEGVPKEWGQVASSAMLLGVKVILGELEGGSWEVWQYWPFQQEGGSWEVGKEGF